MEIRLPQGGGTMVKRFVPPLAGLVSRGCLTSGIMVSSFQRPPTGPPPPPPVDLSVRYNLPPSARLGHDLLYSVTLTNASGHTITLNTCPGYAEGLDGVGAQERHLLNCAPARFLQPGETRTFAMRLLVPATVRRGLRGDAVSWTIDLPFVSASVLGTSRHVELVQ
jgi:hypothetical protein